MIRASRTSRLLVVLGAAVALVAFGSAPADAQRLAGRSVKIGVMMSQTGQGAEWGQQGTVAAQIATDEINAAGGIGGVPIELVLYDTGSKVGEAIAITRKLAHQDKVLTIIGPIFSSECEAVFPLANQLKITIVSPTSASPGTSAKNRPWPFRTNSGSLPQLAGAVAVMAKKHGVKTAVVLYNSADAVSTAEGKLAFPALFKNHGIEVLDMITFQTGTVDFSAQVTRALAKKPDGIAIGALYQEGAGVAREARKQGFTGPIAGGVGTATPDLVTIGGPAVEGFYSGSTAWADNPDPKVVKYVTEFKRRYQGKKPNRAGMAMYDQVYVTKKCIEETGVTNKPDDLDKDREKIRDCWANLKGFPGVTGPVTLNADGDGAGKPYTVQVKGGVFVAVEE